MSDQLSLLLFIVLVALFATSIVPTMKTQHEFLQLYKDKKHPDIPITNEDIHNASVNGQIMPGMATKVTLSRMRIIWSHHEDSALNNMARSIRWGFYRSAAVLIGGIFSIVALDILLRNGRN